MIPSTAAAFLTLTVGTAFAHTGCGGHEIGRRNVGGPMLYSRAVTDEASAAASTGRLIPSYFRAMADHNDSRRRLYRMYSLRLCPRDPDCILFPCYLADRFHPFH